MSGERGWAGRFPGFDVLGQARHWDQATADVVIARTGRPPAPRFFTGPQASCARALLNLLTGQDEHGGELAVPVTEMLDFRLEAGETDGWRYADMPEDGQAWGDTLSYLDADAKQRVNGHWKIRLGGLVISRLAATRFPGWRPPVLAGGTGLGRQRDHPLAGEGLGEAVRVALGQDEVSVVQQSVHRGGCEGFRHDRVES
jgi:hypothetical protein